jgi:hypothetical protein
MSIHGLLFIHDHPPAMLLKTGIETRLSIWKLMRLYAIIVAAANDELGLQWWLSQDTLARRAPMRKQQVQHGLLDLQDLGLIEKIGKRDRSDLWRVIIPDFEQSQASGHDGMPDKSMSGHNGMPDAQTHSRHLNGRSSGHLNGRSSGRSSGHDGMPLTEREPEQTTNSNALAESSVATNGCFESVLREAVRIELELIPTTKATAEQLLPRKKQKWAQTIEQILINYPHASADPQNVNALACAVLERIHPNNHRFALQPPTLQLLLAAELKSVQQAPASPPASPEWLAAYRAQHFPARFRSNVKSNVEREIPQWDTPTTSR